ncbi:MAG: CU044_2847 family protein [Pseudanabaena sp. ELA748]
MEANEIRLKFLKFFETRGHKIIPSASLVPENDPSVLFNTAGMQPLVPYLLGQDHPMGKRIVDIQKCVRTGDLDDIGDNRHFSFFEMMGNWSLGDYFKEDAIKNLQEIHETIRFYTKYAIGAFKNLGDAQVEEVNLKFGLKISGEAGIPILTKASAESNFEISVKCKFPPKSTST